MLLPKVGEEFPNQDQGPHAGHRAVIVAVDAHGQHSFDDDLLFPPTLLVECSCGARWTEDLFEVVGESWSLTA